MYGHSSFENVGHEQSTGKAASAMMSPEGRKQSKASNNHDTEATDRHEAM